MRFLSVAERELRAGARQKGTLHLRWITAAAFVGLLAWLMWIFDGFRASQVFGAFSTVAFFYCLIVGTARTADCLSSEKREGTLGLLFLTNLNGPEIIGGKLCSSALAAAYGVFAIFPLLALQMLIGGITLGHFWRSVLALVNAIFFSVSAAFLASSFCLRQFIAVATATGLALFASLGLMGLSAAANAFRSTKPLSNGLAILSPLYTLISAQGAGGPGRYRYWWSLVAVAGLSSICLALATWRVSNSWQDRARGTYPWSTIRFLQSWRQRASAGNAALRRRLLAINPFYWLGGRSAVSAPLIMLIIVVVVSVTSWIAVPFFGRALRAGPMEGHLFAWLWAGLTVHALVLYYSAVTASRRLAEDKQTGALELVLSTPTSERSISRGLWMAYGRKLFFPATVAILVHFFFIWQGATLAVMELSNEGLPPGATPGQLLWHVFLNRRIGSYQINWGLTLGLQVALLSLLLLLFVWITLGWVGRWLGLRMKHPGFAPIVALALVFVPSIGLFGFAGYCVNKFQLYRMPQRILLPMMAWLAFGIQTGHCLVLSLWAAGCLRRDFRTVVTSRFQPRPFRRWWRPTRRGMVRFGVGAGAAAAVLLIVGLSFYTHQNRRSRRVWSAFQKELQQRRESLDVAPFLSARVSDSQNFALTPAFRNWVAPAETNAATIRLLRELKRFDALTPQAANSLSGIDWAGQNFAPLDEYLAWIAPEAKLAGEPVWEKVANTILQALKPHDETMRTLAADARLPYFQTSTNRAASAVLRSAKKENAALERLHMLFQIRASALLVGNRGADAAEDLLTGLLLARLAQQIPDEQSSIRVQLLLCRSLQPLWEGIVEKRWTEPQLAAFQNELSRFSLLADFTNAVRRVVLANIETWRAIANGQRRGGSLPYAQGDGANSVWAMQPRAWWLESCAQLYQAGETAIKGVDVAAAHVHIGTDWADIEGLPLDVQTISLLQQPNLPGAFPGSVAFAQTAVNQAIIACALERFRLASARFPETLNELLPQYLPEIPKDVVRGVPMLFENHGDGRFTLRSVGPNQTDDRNKPASDDWLWSFPTNAPPATVR